MAVGLSAESEKAFSEYLSAKLQIIRTGFKDQDGAIRHFVTSELQDATLQILARKNVEQLNDHWVIEAWEFCALMLSRAITSVFGIEGVVVTRDRLWCELRIPLQGVTLIAEFGKNSS